MVRSSRKKVEKKGNRRSPRILSANLPTTARARARARAGSINKIGRRRQVQHPPPPTSSQQLVDEHTSHDYPQIHDQQLIVHNENEDQVIVMQVAPDQPPNAPSTPQMPEKRLLELIVDILQRKDTNEIFAEPVDPKQVENYYEIIKEPMDFGTMRAKLHEGMYKTLQQFEHDVFLISRNAMQFNSPGTIFFRQARAIQELAIKVFHTLKTDPSNFELEFSETKRRSSRRPLVEAKGSSSYNISPKPVTNLRSNGLTSNISLKATPSPSRGLPNLKKIIPRDHGCNGASHHSNLKDSEVLTGSADGKRKSFVEVDMRFRPHASFIDENYSMLLPIHDLPKSLMHVNQQGFSYGESLLSFVKDLGPTAQMVAQRKLNGTDDRGRSQTGDCSKQVEDLSNNDKKKSILTSFSREASYGNISNASIMKSNKSKLNSQEQLLVTTLEHSPLNHVFDSKQENDHTSSPSLRPLDMHIDFPFNRAKSFKHNLSSQQLQDNDQPIASEGWSFAFRNPSKATASKTRHPQKLLTSQFVFDLPYLKTRLDQISCGHDITMQQSSQNKVSNQRKLTCTKPLLDDQRQSSLDVQQTDLAL